MTEIYRQRDIWNTKPILKKVYLIDSARSNNLNVLFKLKYKNIKIKFIYGNLLNKKILSQINDNIDVVIHLASISNAEESFKITKFIYHNNITFLKFNHQK